MKEIMSINFWTFLIFLVIVGIMGSLGSESFAQRYIIPYSILAGSTIIAEAIRRQGK